MAVKIVKISKISSIIIGLVAGWLLFSDVIHNTGNSRASELVALAQASNDSTSLASTLYLPTITRKFPYRSLFGIELNSVNTTSGADQMGQAGAYWVRRNGLYWSDVESIQGVLDWTKVNYLAEDMKNASTRGMNVLLVIRGAPDWAANRKCGPIHREQFAAFGSFLAEAVSRFSRPPYNVQYYELWNEPDIDPSMVSPDSQFGCWGDMNDPYYGGSYYGDMLKVVYPMMKSANPQAKIVIGGLLLDCDPAQSGVCGGDRRSGLFLEGILQSTQGDYFDGIAFHAYDYFGDPGSVGRFANPNWDAAWDNALGPVLNAKTAFIKNLLNVYQVSGKFLMNTESALIDIPQNCTICEETKANYLAISYASAIRQGLLANVWFSYYGWRGSQLATSVQTTLPAYKAYDVAQEQFGEATFLQEINSYPNVNVLTFSRGAKTIWLIWSRDGADHLVTLPKTPLEIQDVYGSAQNPVGPDFTVSIEPSYLIFSP